MGTKNNPGQFDCYAKLDPDEPYFTLRSTDETGPFLVRIWAAVQLADMVAADEAYRDMWEAAQGDAFSSPEAFKRTEEKVTEARSCANSMMQYRNGSLPGVNNESN